MPGKRISKAKKSAAAAMIGLGVPTRTVSEELGISNGAAAMAAHDPTVDEQLVKACQQRIAGRMVVASEKFLSHALDRIQELGPYQATLCAGITHDHYLRSKAAGSAEGSTLLVQILMRIDQSQRSRIPDVVIEGEKA